MGQPIDTEFPASIRIDEAGVETRVHKDRGLLNALRSSRGLFVFVLMLLIFTGTAQPITDPDFWWHLRTGQYIVETRRIPYTDIFSTLRFGSEWVTHEWLSEVFIYSVFRTLGYGGLIAIFSILITAAFWIVYQRCRKRGVHPYLAGFALLLGAAATMPTWGVRPQMFSLLFASIFISFLDRYSRREAMPSIWWLAPLMVLWVSLHAGFALGLVLIALTKPRMNLRHARDKSLLDTVESIARDKGRKKRWIGHGRGALSSVLNDSDTTIQVVVSSRLSFRWVS